MLDAHDEALPLLFEYKNKYFSYRLWNALRLRSKNQLRMYEVLKQYEHIGYRIISVQELKDQLGIDENEYPSFKSFRQAVIEVCRNAIAENTDISFSYEPHGKKGPRGKILWLKFTITKNED
jgi:plasmid replication initiation protein